ncbi:hypothetical protein WDZ92_39875, partial [Nostoc sp. NIES-2111]
MSNGAGRAATDGLTPVEIFAAGTVLGPIVGATILSVAAVFFVPANGLTGFLMAGLDARLLVRAPLKDLLILFYLVYA